jgi:hypothetical protein
MFVKKPTARFTGLFDAEEWQCRSMRVNWETISSSDGSRTATGRGFASQSEETSVRARGDIVTVAESIIACAP